MAQYRLPALVGVVPYVKITGQAHQGNAVTRRTAEVNNQAYVGWAMTWSMRSPVADEIPLADDGEQRETHPFLSAETKTSLIITGHRGRPCLSLPHKAKGVRVMKKVMLVDPDDFFNGRRRDPIQQMDDLKIYKKWKKFLKKEAEEAAKKNGGPKTWWANRSVAERTVIIFFVFPPIGVIYIFGLLQIAKVMARSVGIQ